jgi:hypothetical protein
MKREHGKFKRWDSKEATLTDKQRQTRSTKMKVERYTNFSRNPEWWGSSGAYFKKSS